MLMQIGLALKRPLKFFQYRISHTENQGHLFIALSPSLINKLHRRRQFLQPFFFTIFILRQILATVVAAKVCRCVFFFCLMIPYCVICSISTHYIYWGIVVDGCDLCSTYKEEFLALFLRHSDVSHPHVELAEPSNKHKRKNWMANA